MAFPTFTKKNSEMYKQKATQVEKFKALTDQAVAAYLLDFKKAFRTYSKQVDGVLYRLKREKIIKKARYGSQ